MSREKQLLLKKLLRQYKQYLKQNGIKNGDTVSIDMKIVNQSDPRQRRSSQGSDNLDKIITKTGNKLTVAGVDKTQGIVYINSKNNHGFWVVPLQSVTKIK